MQLPENMNELIDILANEATKLFHDKETKLMIEHLKIT